MLRKNDGDEANLFWIMHNSAQVRLATAPHICRFTTINWPMVLALAAEQGLHLHACHDYSCASLLSFLSVYTVQDLRRRSRGASLRKDIIHECFEAKSGEKETFLSES